MSRGSHVEARSPAILERRNRSLARRTWRFGGMTVLFAETRLAIWKAIACFALDRATAIRFALKARGWVA